MTKYNLIKDAMLQIIQQAGEITYQDLSHQLERDLQPTFAGKVIWYVVTVKFDLEARGIIERIPKTSSHQVRIKN